MTEPCRVHLVANARYHDTDFARLQLLSLLGELPDVRTTVAQTFADSESLAESQVLVTYTCDLRPTPEQEAQLAQFVRDGGRWIALHATNALLDFSPAGVRNAPGHDSFMDTLGSRFIAHPRTHPYTVTRSPQKPGEPEHPLVAGIEPFEATDELYLCTYHPDVQPLLETRYTGTFGGGYLDNEWPNDDPRLVAYLRPLGQGCVYYLTLGHCCGVHDMRPLQDVAPVVRGSWENPTYLELLRRAIQWAFV